MTRRTLPLPGGPVFLADSGLETDLIFHQDADLPEFAAFPLLDDPVGVRLLRDYYLAHLDVAHRSGAGIVLEAPTWRASSGWGASLGYDAMRLDEVNRAAIDLLLTLRAENGEPEPIVVSGCVGPRGDAYRPESAMSAADAYDYHRAQVRTFADAGVDVVTAMTLSYADEAIGIARAAEEAGTPVVLSFTVETDGALPDGSSLGAAVTAVDAATGAYPAYFMVNCAHPTHFAAVLEAGVDEVWAQRIGGVRPNASRRSHAELDSAPDLDDGDPVEFGQECAALRAAVPQLTVFGGCCGSDVRHVEQIARACLA